MFKAVAWRGGGAVYFGSSRTHPFPLHAATHHDSKPMSPFSGIRLPAGPLQFRSQEYGDRCSSAQAFGGSLLALPSARPRIRSTAGAPFRIYSFLVFLLYSMRRVDCRRCEAVVVEEVPWGDGKRTLTRAYLLFLARWARRLS